MAINDTLSTVPEQYRQHVLAAAEQYGLDPLTIVRLIREESGWNPNVQSSSAGAIGLAQFMPETAAEVGIDPTDPIQSIYGAAKYLAQLGQIFGWKPEEGLLAGTELELAVASYVSGPGTVQQAIKQAQENVMPGSMTEEFLLQRFRQIWPEITNDPAGVSNYLSSITGAPSSSDFAASDEQLRELGPKGFAAPKLEDFKVYEQDQISGLTVWTGEYDIAAFNRAQSEFQTFQSGGTNLASFLDATISNIGRQIEAGQLNVSKARQEFQRQLEAHQVASDDFISLVGYSLPVGQEYVTGREPGGFWEQRGLPPIKASGMNFNPFEAAMDVVNRTPNLAAIPTPQPQSIGAVVDTAQQLTNAAGAPGAAPGTVGTVPPPAAPAAGVPPAAVPPPAANSPTASAEAVALAERFLRR